MEDMRFEAGRYFLKDLVRLRIDFSSTDQGRHVAPPPQQRTCPADAPRITLPGGRAALEHLCRIPLGEAIAQRESVRRYSRTPLTLEELSALLWAVQGVRMVVGGDCALRTVPSAGARHPFETYIAATHVESLAPGLYRYLPLENELAQLSTDEDVGRQAADACHGQTFMAEAAAVFFWTAIPARSEWRYGEAAHKVIAIDAGHVCQNLYLAAGGIGAGVCAIAAYSQEACDALLGVDGSEEFTVYIAALGKH